MSERSITIGAYYYPWYGPSFHHGQGYLRKLLNDRQQPTLGEYDDTKASVIAQHLDWSRQANISVLVSSWWGPKNPEDKTIRNVIMDHAEIGDLKIALHYETMGRIKESEGYSTQRVMDDVRHMCKHYFHHKNYYKIDGRPVLVVYLTRSLATKGKLEEVLLLMRTAADECGERLYIIGDHVFGKAPQKDNNLSAFRYLDAITCYDVYGSMRAKTEYAGKKIVDRFYQEEQTGWKLSSGSSCAFVPAVSPGFNDRGVRLKADHRPLSRKLTSDDEFGSLFEYALPQAIKLVDSRSDNLLMVNSFNEWHEDSQIEPVEGPLTNGPNELTHGVSYEGYGDRYLNILRDLTTKVSIADEL